ncbi:DUF775-domain-containing protein [Aspergillus pseudoustus]|uniref:DUF775-domain-containing protein n=1 Tax=Aspergillus pseudoustus TaxID=1810923 RepID=A0ABR4KM14_9EURO
MFSVIIPGRPCLTDIVAVDTQPNGQSTKFAFNFPLAPHFSEIVVFFLPGTVLPPDTAAAIYIQYPGADFRFIGALANEKPSSVIKVSPPRRTESQDEDQMLDAGGMNGDNSSMVATLGISIEPVQVVAPQLAALEAETGSGSVAGNELVRQTPQQRGISTKVLAQRIIGSAFNFLASFSESSDPMRGGQEVVPLKAFQDWWTKFERRVNADPTFLERQDPTANG